MEPISIHLGWSMFAGVVIGVAVVLLIKANRWTVPVINPEPDATPEPTPSRREREVDAAPRPAAPKPAATAAGQTHDEKVIALFSARLTQIADGLATPTDQELRMAKVVKRKLDAVLEDLTPTKPIA